MHRGRPALQRPPRGPKAGKWWRIVPTTGKWSDLARNTDSPMIRELHALLDQQLLEIWQDDRGHFAIFASQPHQGSPHARLPAPSSVNLE
jgi:hypothetical protein